MKPKPFVGLNHFTVPIAIGLSSNTLPPLGSERRVKLQHGAGSRSGARSGARERKPNHGESTVNQISRATSSCNSELKITRQSSPFHPAQKSDAGSDGLSAQANDRLGLGQVRASRTAHLERGFDDIVGVLKKDVAPQCVHHASPPAWAGVRVPIAGGDGSRVSQASAPVAC